MNQKLSILSLLLLFTTAGFAQVTATQPPDIMQCGFEVFNLTQQDDIILGDQDPEYYFVTYFETQADAEANTNVIMEAQQYVSNGQNQTIYARVSSTMDDGFAVTSFEISWSSWQEIPINEPTPLEACYEEGAEFVVVDFTSKADEILAGTTGFELTYYLTGNDVEMGTNPISNPEAFEWPVGGFDYDYIYVRVTNPVTGCFNITTIEVVIVECTDSTISGTLTFDDGENGCADGSPGAYIMLSLTHDNDVYYTYTDANGNYTFYNVPDGVNIINVMGQGVQTYQTLPASYTLTTPAVLEGNDFCLTTPEPYNDVAVYIIPYQAPRPGFPFQCAILIQNLGNTTLNGEVTLQFDDTIVTYNSSSPSMTLSGNTLTIPYTSLDPFTPQYIYVDFTVFTPPTVNEGDILELIANVTAVEGDDDTSNNQQELALTVVNSWDPNDIACREGEFITEEQADGYLHYLIRFQNTGNADAINIRIEDILDSKFNAATFQPIAASHNYRIEMEGSTVQFIFEDINLPGEEVNEPESHGFISYRIKPNTNVQLGDTFEATAGIYFDFNEPVITNTATTTIQNAMSAGGFAKGSFTVYPNPAKDIITIATQDELSSYEVLNILGQVLLKGNFQSGENNISVESLSKGTYILNLNTADGSSQSSKIIKE